MLRLSLRTAPLLVQHPGQSKEVSNQWTFHRFIVHRCEWCDLRCLLKEWKDLQRPQCAAAAADHV